MINIKNKKQQIVDNNYYNNECLFNWKLSHLFSFQLSFYNSTLPGEPLKNKNLSQINDKIYNYVRNCKKSSSFRPPL